MKKLLLPVLALVLLAGASCEKEKDSSPSNGVCADNPKTPVGTALQGNWMYGNFSMTEYWSTDPSEYMGNALTFAIAFKFKPDGTYELYFTSSSVSGGVTTYQQSVTKGTVVVDETTQKITTYACSAHYKRTRNGQKVEERDLRPDELNAPTSYQYSAAEANDGTRALDLLLQNTTDPLRFYEKF